MALTQSARFGPSWDEEVVPALRKRLESESRTLARRMSAVSLSSMDEPPTGPSFSALSEAALREHSGAQVNVGYQRPTISERNMPASSSRININGTSSSKKPTPPSFQQRSRTYSQPYITDLPNGKTNGTARPRTNVSKSNDPSRSFSPRPSDLKPTRIPKASRPQTGTSSNGNSPQMNGYVDHPPLPDILQVVHEAPSLTSLSTVNVPNAQNSGLLNEPPPFKPGSMTSSIVPSQYDSPSRYGHHQGDYAYTTAEEPPPRQSNESEERPFEHWYRGEVSRNGGVGELRVGRRQEMLEIANYGHTIRNNAKASTSRTPVAGIDQNAHEGSGRWHRKRADSIAGIGTKGRERGSLYLDEEHAQEVGRVLDENPPTDLDGEGSGSDIESTSEHNHHYNSDHHRNYSIPQQQSLSPDPDISTASAPLPHPYYESRSSTPTPSTIQRPSSRQHSTAPPTRIPGPPSSRVSSDTTTTRGPTPTQMTRGASEPPVFPSATSPTPSRHQQQQRQQSKTPPPKRGPSPASSAAKKASRTTASKATRAKTLASRKELEEEAKRRSVAYYPTPEGGEDMMMMDAIPSWTQPVPREGNWDDVVLPVVARKKGLDGHYEQADGSPRPRKVDSAVEPAPGTFGFDHSKYRPPQNPEFIPMDEFGRPTTRIMEEQQHTNGPDAINDTTVGSTHDETRLPVRHPPSSSPAPFSHYAPTSEKVQVPMVTVGGAMTQDMERQGRQEAEEEKSAGCCSSCVIM